MRFLYVLTKEYSDGSGFYVNGVTDSEVAAIAWRAGENHKAYHVRLNAIEPEGWNELSLVGKEVTA